MSEIAALILGFAGGLAGGLLGVGGGVLFVPALAIFLDQTQVEAEATSLLAIVPVALVAVWRQLGYGNVRVRDGLVIGALSPLGVVIGVVAANAISQRALELIFAGLALVIAVQLVLRAVRAPEPLDARVQGVQPVEGERLGRPEPAAASLATALGAVMGEEAVEQRRPPLRRQLPRGRPDDLRPQGQVAEQPAFLGHAELGSVGELPRLSDVVEQRGGHQQVGVQPG